MLKAASPGNYITRTEVNILNTPIRGEIYYADLDGIGSEQQGRRPVLILQDNSLNESSPTAIIVPITSVIKHPFMHSHVILDKSCPLRERSMVLCEQIRVIDRQRLDYFVGRLGQVEMQGIERAVCYSLGLGRERGAP
jgi:mRNA interferase MazF